MGVIIFGLATIAGVYWLVKFYRSLSNDMPAASWRRTAGAVPQSRSLSREVPVITPVADVKISTKISPPVVTPVSVPTAVSLRSVDILPNFSIAATAIEESLLLRLLCLGLFILSSISVDLAAGTHYSYLSIPFTLVGATWSWYRRHAAKHWLNISLSVVSLAVLFGLVVPILSKDSQLAINQLAMSERHGVASTPIAWGLGMLLVSLQMGLSFHLNSRKLLGYGILISGILMSIAAMLSQNISFGLCLGGFIAIIIPALMLDYRSRLALPPIGIISSPTQPQLTYHHLPWKYLSQLAGISIGLGLIIAVFLPNFHLPNLSFHPPGLDKLPPLAQQDRDRLWSLAHLPSPQPSATPPPLTAGEMATKILGQPGNNNYPDTIKQENLQLPPEIASDLKQFVQKILATSAKPLTTDYERAAYLAEYLKQHHREYPQPLNPANLSPADAKFMQQLMAKCAPAVQKCQLTGQKQDLPIVYISMLRSIGIPARLKTGEQLGKFDPLTKMYLRPNVAADSQTEVYFPNWGWFALDSKPDQPLLNPDAQQLAQLYQQVQQIVRSDSQAMPTSPNLEPNPRSPNPQISSPSPNAAPAINQQDQRNSSPPNPPTALPQWASDPVLLRVIIVTIGIGGAIAWYLWYQRQQQQQIAHLPPVEQIYRSMVTDLSKQGLSKSLSQTQLEYAHSASQIYHPQIAKVVREISQVYTAWRYGKQPIDVKQLAKKLQYLQYLQRLAVKKQHQEQLDRFKSQWGLKRSSRH